MSDERGRGDPAHNQPAGVWLRRLVVALLVLLGLAGLLVIFAAYQHPDMLIDFSNLMFCG